jgi:hypothetical protein
MNPRLANAIVIGLEVAAVVIVVSTVYNTLSLLADSTQGRSPVSFDSGRHYLVLMLIFPWLHWCGILNRRATIALSKLSKVTVVFFVGLIGGAWGSVLFVEDRLDTAGYVVCPGPAQYRVSPGKHLTYALRGEGCGNQVGK